MKKINLFIIASIFLVVLTGCTTKNTSTSGNKSTNNTPTPEVTSTTKTEPCDLLTAADAKQVLGDEVVQGTATETSCTYTGANISNIKVITFVLTESTIAEAKLTYESAKTAAYGNKVEDVAGLEADAALWATELKQLSILKGSKWMIVSTIASGPTSDKDLSIQAAKLILEKL